MDVRPAGHGFGARTGQRVASPVWALGGLVRVRNVGGREHLSDRRRPERNGRSAGDADRHLGPAVAAADRRVAAGDDAPLELSGCYSGFQMAGLGAAGLRGGGGAGQAGLAPGRPVHVRAAHRRERWRPGNAGGHSGFGDFTVYLLLANGANRRGRTVTRTADRARAPRRDGRRVEGGPRRYRDRHGAGLRGDVFHHADGGQHAVSGRRAKYPNGSPGRRSAAAARRARGLRAVQPGVPRRRACWGCRHWPAR